MERPLVSIIIPAYNAAEVIGRSCACALTQTEQNVEVIVIDDGSPDETTAVVEEIARSDGRVHLVRHEVNRGRLEARRTGIMSAQGTFTLFLDADDEILPDLAQRLLELQDNRFDIVQCSFEMRYIDYVSDGDRSWQLWAEFPEGVPGETISFTCQFHRGDRFPVKFTWTYAWNE